MKPFLCIDISEDKSSEAVSGIYKRPSVRDDARLA